MIVAASRCLPEFVRHHPPLHLTDSVTGLSCCKTGFRNNLPERHILPLPAFHSVQVRFTPAHERFHLALCSPGDVSQVWVLVLVNAGGEPFAVVQVQRRFASEAVSHSLALAASLDTQGYSVNDIIHILMAEGGQV